MTAEPFLHDASSFVAERWGIKDCLVKPFLVSENTTYEVVDNEGGNRWFLRVCPPSHRSLSQISAELAFIDLAHRYTPPAGIRFVDIVPGLNGDRVQIGSDACCDAPLLLSQALPDSFAVRPDDPAAFGTYGRIAAYLHRCVLGTSRVDRPLLDAEGLVGSQGVWGNWRDYPGLSTQDLSLFETCCSSVFESFSAYGMKDLTFGLIHSDLRSSNVLFFDDEGERLAGVLDFDDSAYSWFAMDLAGSLSFVEESPRAQACAHAWVRGYGESGALRREDVSIVPTCVMARRLQLMAWLANHPQSDPASRYLDRFLAGTRAVARSYLNDSSWMQLELGTQQARWRP